MGAAKNQYLDDLYLQDNIDTVNNLISQVRELRRKCNRLIAENAQLKAKIENDLKTPEAAHV